jgi:hypothetical protein
MRDEKMSLEEANKSLKRALLNRENDLLHARKVNRELQAKLDLAGAEPTLGKQGLAVTASEPRLEPDVDPLSVPVNQPEPQPITNSGPAVWDLVIQDMRERDASGLEKYGTRLQPHNGRNALVDAYQEALDLVVYLRQAIVEQESAPERDRAGEAMEPDPDRTAGLMSEAESPNGRGMETPLCSQRTVAPAHFCSHGSPIYDMGEEHTGCTFCAFGAHMEKEPNRFQRLKKSHPKHWGICMDKLGSRAVLGHMGIPIE